MVLWVCTAPMCGKCFACASDEGWFSEWHQCYGRARYIRTKRTICSAPKTDSNSDTTTSDPVSTHTRRAQVNFARSLALNNFHSKWPPIFFFLSLFIRDNARTRNVGWDRCSSGTLSFMVFSSTEMKLNGRPEWWMLRGVACRAWLAVFVCKAFRNRIIIMALMCLNSLLFNCVAFAYRDRLSAEQKRLEVDVIGRGEKTGAGNIAATDA